MALHRDGIVKSEELRPGRGYPFRALVIDHSGGHDIGAHTLDELRALFCHEMAEYPEEFDTNFKTLQSMAKPQGACMAYYWQ